MCIRDRLIKHPLSIKYQKLACYLHWLILIVNNVSLKVGTWVGGKPVSCTVTAFDMGAIVPLNLISTKQAGFRKIRFHWVMNCSGDVYKPWKSQDFIVLEGLSIFDLENIRTVKIWLTRYILQSSKMADPFKDQMPSYFQSVENKLHERNWKKRGKRALIPRGLRVNTEDQGIEQH